MLFNSLTKTKEPLPRGKPLTWYTCGPTVYDHAHIGHARAYVALDIVRRVLVHQGYCVFQVMGMTDIDDKIIAKAKVSFRLQGALILQHANHVRCYLVVCGVGSLTVIISRRSKACPAWPVQRKCRAALSMTSSLIWQR